MTTAFISYSRRDAQMVLPFAEQLRASGFDVWLDQSSIQAAVPWLSEITKAIRGCDFVILMQSDAWLASSSCADEHRIAKEQDKSILSLHVMGSPSDWVAAAKAADAQIDAPERERSALLGTSYRWWQAGSPSTHLVAGATLRTYRRALRTTPDQVAADFVHASRRRVRRRRFIAALLALLTTVLATTRVVSTLVADELQSQVVDAVDQLGAERRVAAALQRGPVEGLRVASTLAEEDDAWATRVALALALDEHLPFRVDAPSSQPVPPAPALPLGSVVGHEGRELTVVPGGVRLEDGRAMLMTRFDGAVTALAWHPAGTWFAVATSHEVLVVRASTGREVARLVGFGGRVHSLRWENEATLVGAAGATTVLWSVPSLALLAHSGWRFDALVQGPTGDTLGVGAGGELALVEDSGVRLLQSVGGGGQWQAAMATPSGWLVAVSDAEENGSLTEITATGEAGRSIDLGECMPSAMDREQTGAILVACLGQDVAVVDLAAERVDRLQAESFQMESLLVDVDGTPLATSTNAELLRWSGSDWQPLGQWAGNCTRGARVFESSPDGSRLLIAGQGAAGLCTHLRNQPDNRGERTTIVAPPGIQTFIDADWSPDGNTLALAAASGELWVFDAEHYVTRAVLVPTGAALTSVAFVDPRTVLVGSVDGELVAVDVHTAVGDLSAQIAEARHRVALAEEAGIE